MKKLNRSTGLRARAPLAMAVAFALLSAPAVQAFEFSNGELTGNLDTTVSLGYSWRTEDRDPDLIGKANFNPLIGGFNQGIAAPFLPDKPLGSFNCRINMGDPGPGLRLDRKTESRPHFQTDGGGDFILPCRVKGADALHQRQPGGETGAGPAHECSAGGQNCGLGISSRSKGDSGKGAFG